MTRAALLVDETMHGWRRDHPGRGRLQRISRAVDRQGDGAAGQQIELMNVLMTVRGDVPVMEASAHLNRLVMQHVVRLKVPHFPEWHRQQGCGRAHTCRPSG